MIITSIIAAVFGLLILFSALARAIKCAASENSPSDLCVGGISCGFGLFVFGALFAACYWNSPW